MQKYSSMENFGTITPISKKEGNKQYGKIIWKGIWLRPQIAMRVYAKQNMQDHIFIWENDTNDEKPTNRRMYVRGISGLG